MSHLSWKLQYVKDPVQDVDYEVDEVDISTGTLESECLVPTVKTTPPASQSDISEAEIKAMKV